MSLDFAPGWEAFLRSHLRGPCLKHGSQVAGHAWLMAHLASRSRGEVVECGVGYGGSTGILLAALSSSRRPIVSIDIAKGMEASVWAALPPGFHADVKSRWRFLVSDAAAAASGFADSSVGFWFLDTSHTLDDTRRELAAWLPKMRPDGVMCGHDYWLELQWGGLAGVKPAVDEFAALHRSRFELETFKHDCGFFVLHPR